MEGSGGQIAVALTNGATLVIQDVASAAVPAPTADAPPGEGFGFGTQPVRFESVTKVIEGIAEELKATLDKVTPHSATVEFGLEVTGEPGFLTAALVKGSGTAHLPLPLEWEPSAAAPGG